MPAYCATLRTLAQANKVIAANQAGLLKALFKQLTGSLLLRHTGIQFAAIHSGKLLAIENGKVDNALDACDEAEVPPVIEVACDAGGISVSDNGLGLPESTLLRQLGIDHTRLSVKFQGLDVRLTGIAGRVIQDII